MSSPWALYVEDEVGEAADRFQREIRDAGFRVARAHSAAEARARLAEVAASQGIVDLVVLDRKLPERDGDRAIESSGDALFRAVEADFPDSAIMILTGYSDEDFALLVLQRRNVLEVGPREPIQRVVHFKKSQALDFRSALRALGTALRETEDLALEGPVTAQSTRRVLKRVGQLFGGAVVDVRPAVGGLSDATVWICGVVAEDGRLLTSVVVKTGVHGDMRPSGGFMASIPSANAASPIHLVAGACGGACGHVAPLAGEGSVSLADLLASDETRAVDAVAQVVEVLDGVASATTSLRLDRFVSPLIDWPRGEQIAAALEIELPNPELPIPTHVGCLHGDLHPGNVLVVEDRPVFIDFDRQRVGALVLDGLSLALGGVFNKASPLRDRAPSLEEVEAAISGHQEESTWLGACARSWSLRGFGQRERWAGVLAYALRQLKYADVLDDDARRALAVGLAQRASEVLRAS
ncbi:phosphotransferase [Cellulomonas cellasea]|uniref:phosphotransferase n=1 Tax=Cellulomonas cellasea TaxID=43670 RepID=UPI0025A38401|nr:phosphotransferase [Cellulomonas cellasea]MDM8083315.1 phosphotransferase [Cellulomonas cellasea]